MNRRDLAQLGEIANLVAETDLADLAKLRTTLETLSAEARELSMSPTSDRSSTELDPALRAGIMPQWEAWRRERLRKIQTERARVFVEMEAARAKAQKSFGRNQAIAELLTRDP